MSATAPAVCQHTCRWAAGPEPSWHIAAVLAMGGRVQSDAPATGFRRAGRGAFSAWQCCANQSRKAQKLEADRARARAVTATRRAPSVDDTAARPRTRPRRTRPAAPRESISSRQSGQGFCQHSQRSNRTACWLHKASAQSVPSESEHPVLHRHQASGSQRGSRRGSVKENDCQIATA